MTTLLTLDAVRANVETDLSNDALQRVIDGEDAYIRKMVGPHDGEFTETIRGEGYLLWLTKQAASVSLVKEYGWRADPQRPQTLAATAYTIEQYGHALWRRYLAWDTFVDVTYTPVEENALRIKALIELVRLAAQDTGVANQRVGSYSSVAFPRDEERRRIIAPLRHPIGGILA